MTIEEIARLVEGSIVCGDAYKEQNVERVFASDLMSDVLTQKETDELILMTGLCNLQSVRTCEMSDISMMLVVRNKKVTEEMMELANDNEMIIIQTGFSMFRAAGVLYAAGLKPVY